MHNDLYEISMLKVNFIGNWCWTTPLFVIIQGKPDMVTARSAFFTNLVPLWLRSWTVMNCANDHYRNHFAIINSKEVQVENQQNGVFAWAAVYSLWLIHKYSVRNTYGVYCCNYFPRANMYTKYMTVIFANYFDFYMKAALKKISLIMGEDAAATWGTPLNFAWKKFQYTVRVLLTVEDSPYKMWCACCSLFQTTLCTTAPIASSMAGAASFGEVLSYFIIDCTLCTLRVALLARAGAKTCPRIFKFMLAKQLQNIYSPLPVPTASMGAKNAMRVLQGLGVLIEGEGLTVNLLWVTVYFVLWGLLIADPMVWLVIPYKKWGGVIILVFLAIDSIQDVVAYKVATKVANYSYLYSPELGMTSKSHRLQYVMFVYVLTILWLYQPGGSNMDSLFGLQKENFVFFISFTCFPPEQALFHL